MAQFYTTVSNSRGKENGTCGTKEGQECHIRGWDSGIRVVAAREGDRDVFKIFVTGGSNKPQNVYEAATLIENGNDSPIFSTFKETKR